MTAARLVAVAVVALGLATGPGVARAVDPTDLIQVTPAAVELTVPAPGHETSWTIVVRDTETTAGTAVPLWLAVSGADGPLLHGTDPLHLTVTAEDGTVVLASSDLASLFDRHVPLADLRGSATLTATAALPRAAGDAYRGAEGHVELTVTAQAPDVTSDVLAAPGNAPTGLRGMLARTGLEPTALVLVTAVLLGTGATALAARRRRPARITSTASTASTARPARAIRASSAMRTSEEDR